MRPLPTAEPKPGADEQVASLQKSLRDLEATFRYMGKGHPQYESTRDRIEQIRGMLARAKSET